MKNLILLSLVIFGFTGCSLLKIASQPFKNTVSNIFGTRVENRYQTLTDGFESKINSQAFKAADAGENDNTVIGYLAGSAINHASSDNNVIIGKSAGTGGGLMSGCIYIGTKAGEFFNGIIVGGDAGGSVVANGTSNDFIQCKATATSGEEFFIFSDGTRIHASGLAIDVTDTLFADAAAA